MYQIVFALLYLLSLLPMRLLHGLSSILAALLYYIIRYRRDVVAANLAIAFPEKTAAERNKIERQFYRNFTDNFIETLKLLSASENFIRQHFVIDNPEILDEFYNDKRKAQLHLGHTFNWEIANVAFPLLHPYKFLVAYMPVSNKIFERLTLYMRTRTGSVLLPATKLSRAILPYRNEKYLLTLVADQAPGGPDHAFWLNFFGRPTPFVKGPEKGARIADIPAVFVRFHRPKRGYYQVHLTTISNHSAAVPEGEITRQYVKMLEDAIRQEPALYLWSHRRWKTPWREEFKKLWIG